MFKHILIFSTTLLITCSLIGCSKDKDGTITVYGYASVNGVAYKDYVSIYDAFHPDLPIKPTLFNGDRLGVYNDRIPQGEVFPNLDKSYQLSKNLMYDKDRTIFEDFLKYIPVSENNNDSRGIAIIIDYNKLPSATSIDGTIIFKKFNNRTKKLDGEFSDVLSYNKVQLQ